VSETFESQRLLFRDHQPSDLDAYCDMEQDPEVRRYVGGEPRARKDAERRFLAGLPTAKSPLSVRAVILKARGIYIGRAGPYPHLDAKGPIEGEAVLSFYLAREYWGLGLATEAGQAFIRQGFDVLGLNRIVATIDARNTASRRVLDKLGFSLFETEPGPRTFEKFELPSAGRLFDGLGA
jgi:ribosomal-protein-alanine N-acetyltransferase